MTTAVRERGILFSAPMVLRLLDGTKGQTRRPVKPQPVHEPGANGWTWGGMCFGRHEGDLREAIEERCPYGQPGDRLWVRETWRRGGLDLVMTSQVFYRADGEFSGKDNPGLWLKSPSLDCDVGWRPSIHMPRWASRLTLEVTGVRVERLRAITVEDLRAEGVRYQSPYWNGSLHKVKGTPKAFNTPVAAFADIWNDTYAKRGLGWDADPWVWVLEFKRTAQEAPA